jgi:glucan-binding YG repeat protein
LAKLHGAIASLDQDIKNIEREESGKATWWGYFTSILQGPQETEEARIKRDNDRLRKIAARRIRDSEVQREIAAVRDLENAINATHSSITSAEFKIRTEKYREEREEREEQEKRRMEEERLRQEANRRMAEELRKQQEKRRVEEERLRQEANRRMAEELRKQQEKQAQQANKGYKYPSQEQGASRSRNSVQSEGKQNFHEKETCHHHGWWIQIDVPTPCSRCSSVTRKFIFQCPGCGKLACASCREAIKGVRFRSNRFGNGTYHNSSQFTDYTSYSERDNYFD